MQAQAQHASTDHVTGWWRGVSLRAKVTGVTVAVLVIGLVAAGMGTMVFLRTTLLANLDTQVRQLAAGNAVSALFTYTVTPDGVTFVSRDDAVSTTYALAIYEPENGELIVGAGDGASNVEFPSTFTLAQATILGTEPFTLQSVDGDDTYRASVGVLQVEGSTIAFTQLVAISTSSTERVVATFVWIYLLLALVTVVVGAFLVRWVVTLTFRSLGQVERTADAIAGGDFSQRMTDIEPGTTEVGRLKRAINAMLGRVDAAISQRDATVRQMRRFIGDASHELRTPLVTVRGYAELYRMGAIPDAEATGQAMERIEKEAIRMTSMVEDLLALARLDERRPVTLAPIDLRPIARDAALDVRAAAPQRTIAVIDTTMGQWRQPQPAPPAPATGEEGQPRRRGGMPTAAIGLAARFRRRGRNANGTSTGDTGELTPLTSEPVQYAMPPVVMGEENLIRQVVANLLGNAQRFSPIDSPIELRLGSDEDDRTGWIEVVDHGEGVPEQIREQIFQRFWRADTSRTRETGGSGLGLSIVASIVESLRGSVSVRDSDGGGATFRVSFPLAVDQDVTAHLLIDTVPLQRTQLLPPDLLRPAAAPQGAPGVVDATATDAPSPETEPER